MIRGIPSPSFVSEPNLQRLLSSMREAVQILAGLQGPPQEKAVTVAQLISTGLFQLNADGALVCNPGWARDMSGPSSPLFAGLVEWNVTGGQPAASAIHLGLTVPSNTRILYAYYTLYERFESEHDNDARISLGIDVDAPTGLVSTTRIRGYSAWTELGFHLCRPRWDENITPLTTEARAIIANVSDYNLTAGKLKLFVLGATEG